MSGLEAPKQPEAPKQQPEAPKQQPEAPKQQPETVKQQPETVKQQPETAKQQPETVKQEAKDVLESEETKVVLDKMKKIEDYINNIPDEKLNSYKGIILEYNSIKDDIKQKMKEDSNFQEAMEQVGMRLDNNHQPLDTIGEPAAGELVSEVLANNETANQIKNVNYVISGYDKLNPKQQEALNKGLAIFKEKLEKIVKDIVKLDQYNYEVGEAA